jgi:DnaJ-class molecular chaperone
MASEAAQLIKKVNQHSDDYYAILGLSKGAGEDEIKKAYKKIALRLHPDKCKEDGAEEAFKKVNEAVSVLTDAEKRNIYDQCGVDGLRGGGGGGGTGGIDPEDIFAAFFGGGMPAGATFVQTSGMGRNGFQTFTFSTGGPRGGSMHFSGGSPFGGSFHNIGGSPGMRRRQQQQQQREEAEREAEEIPAWLKNLQTFASSLGPLMPFAFLAMLALTFMLLTTAFQIFVQVMFRLNWLILPIMFLTSGKIRTILICSIVLAHILGVV